MFLPTLFAELIGELYRPFLSTPHCIQKIKLKVQMFVNYIETNPERMKQ
jgi:hypothetical protein